MEKDRPGRQDSSGPAVALMTGPTRQAVELRNMLRSCHWEYQKELLVLLDWVCPTDRQFDVARKRMLDVINGEERAICQIVNDYLGFGKENGNGRA